MSSSNSTSSSSSSSSTTPNHLGPVIVPPPVSVCVRRMSPQEDLLATLMGIDVLVRQRQQLINGLVGQHQRLSRHNEIGALAQFSKEIDAIMKMRGLSVLPPPLSRRLSAEWDQESDFRPRNMDADEGIKSLQKMLNLEYKKKKKLNN